MEKLNGDYKYYFITGVILDFDTNKFRRFKRLKREELEQARKIFHKIYKGTIFGVTERGNWKIVERKDISKDNITII